MRTLLPALLLLTGCPYIWGPPELAVRDTDADTDSDSDSDSDTDTDTGIPTTGLPTGTTTIPVPPEITSAEAHFGYGVARISVAIDAAPGSLEGGLLHVDDGVLPVDLVIPDDLADWDPNGLATVEVPTDLPCGGFSLSWTVSVTDFDGRSSGDAVANLAVSGHDHVEGGEPTMLGSLNPPAILCGTLGNSGDTDRANFDNTAGTWVFSLHDLTAGTPKNRNLELKDGSGSVVLQQAISAADPDSLQETLNPASEYQIRVYSPVGGSGSDYIVVVHE